MKTYANANENNHEITGAALRRKVEERAYHLWLENGCGHGNHEHHWLQAEREVMAAAKPEGNPQSDAHPGKKTARPR